MSRNTVIKMNASDKNLFKAIFDSSSEAILIISLEGFVIDFNQKAQQLFGYDDASFENLPLNKLLPDRYRAMHTKQVESYHCQPKARSMAEGSQLFAIKKSGEEFPVKVSLNPIKENNEVLFVLALVMDITEQEVAKEKLRLVNEELELKVRDRTKELRTLVNKLEEKNNEVNAAKEEIIMALNREKEINELKSRFVTTASHEFRTPLSAILSSVSLLEKYTETSQQDKRAKHIERIKKSVFSLNTILNEFLSLEKIETGKFEVSKDQVNINKSIQQAIEQCSEIMKKDQYVVFNPEQVFTIITDKSAFDHIIINLLSNAIKYSNEGKEILIQLEKENQHELKISVKDQGIGIPKEELMHLFERFFRAKNAINIQGTGLGLHIVKRYIDLIQGEIEIDSIYEEGTTVTLKLPLQ